MKVLLYNKTENKGQRQFLPHTTDPLFTKVYLQECDIYYNLLSYTDTTLFPKPIDLHGSKLFFTNCSMTSDNYLMTCINLYSIALIFTTIMISFVPIIHIFPDHCLLQFLENQKSKHHFSSQIQVTVHCHRGSQQWDLEDSQLYQSHQSQRGMDAFKLDLSIIFSSEPSAKEMVLTTAVWAF